MAISATARDTVDLPETGLNQPDSRTHDLLWQYCAHDLGRLRGQLGENWALLKAYNLDRAAAVELKQPQLALMQHFGFPGDRADRVEAHHGSDHADLGPQRPRNPAVLRGECGDALRLGTPCDRRLR